MKYKDKAQELIKAFEPFVQDKDHDGFQCINLELDNAKNCALIAVDEIMKTYYDDTDDSVIYWANVKAEIISYGR